MKKLLFVFVTLLVLIAAGLAVYVASIDWNQHKDKIAQQFSELTGKTLCLRDRCLFVSCRLLI